MQDCVTRMRRDTFETRPLVLRATGVYGHGYPVHAVTLFGTL